MTSRRVQSASPRGSISYLIFMLIVALNNAGVCAYEYLPKSLPRMHCFQTSLLETNSGLQPLRGQGYRLQVPPDTIK